MYFTEVGNNDVREIVKATGKIQTVAGSGGTQGYSGDGALATSATLNQPQGLAMDAAGNLYIADTGNSVIREISAATGTISTIAGNGTPTYGGDGGRATSASLNQPYGLASAGGSLYVADLLNNRVRRIDPSGIITTVAGTGQAGYAGDTQPASNARLNHPYAVAVDPAGDLFISDSENNVVRKINAATQVITTFAGNSAAGSTGDGVNADSGNPEINRPFGLVLDSGGDLFIADQLGLRVRAVYGNVGNILYKDIKVTNTSAPVSQRLDNDGNAPLQLTSIAPVSNAAIDPASTTCNTTSSMAPGAECTIGVEFKPAVVGSPITGSISIASNAANSADTVYLSGNSLSIEPTTTTLVSSTNPSAVGQAVIFTASISSLYTGNPPLNGTVQFLDSSNGNALLGGAAQNVTSTRTATLTTAGLSLGSHSIVAVYSGDSNNQTSTSSPALVQVVKQSTNLSLTSNDNPARVYDSITFTVNASASPAGGPIPTGSISFYADGSLLPGCSVNLNSGVATCSNSLLTAGSHTITASYAGDINNLPANSNALTQVVNVATTTTTLATSNASVLLTAPVTFTAQVTGTNSSVPTGNIVFKDGAATIGTIGVNGSGVATITTSTLTAGTHTITAVYGGDTDYNSSTSAPLIQTIQKVATSAAVISSANPANAGATVRFTVTVTAANSTSPNVSITGPVT